MDKIGRRLVVGDIHARMKPLMRVLQKSEFNRNKDKLILIGDLVDRGDDSKTVIQYLCKLPNVVLVLGNHDLFFKEYIESNGAGSIFKIGKGNWMPNGGQPTIKSYCVRGKDFRIAIPKSHKEFIMRGKLWHIEPGNDGKEILFVHGSITPGRHPQDEDINTLTWGRNIVEYAMRGNRVDPWEKVFVGHTPVQFYDIKLSSPLISENVINIDCGMGKEEGIRKGGGKPNLAVMDIDTMDVWLSD